MRSEEQRRLWNKDVGVSIVREAGHEHCAGSSLQRNSHEVEKKTKVSRKEKEEGLKSKKKRKRKTTKLVLKEELVWWTRPWGVYLAAGDGGVHPRYPRYLTQGTSLSEVRRYL